MIPTTQNLTTPHCNDSPTCPHVCGIGGEAVTIQRWIGKEKFGRETKRNLAGKQKKFGRETNKEVWQRNHKKFGREIRSLAGKPNVVCRKTKDIWQGN